MNNLRKLGLTALAGSLVAVGAQAGEVSINGSANMVYKTNSGSEGKGLGTDKGLTVSGSGELDNGWTFALHTYISDAMTMSTHTTSLTMGSLGTVTAGSWGGNATSFDEEVPNAYEQTSDISNDGSSNRIGTFMGSGGLTWALPSFDLGGASASVLLGWSPNGQAAASTDGGMPTKTGTWGTGVDAGVTITTDMGLTIGAYVAERENEKPVATTADKVRDEFNGVWYAKYSMGPVSVGYSHSYLDSGVQGSAEAVTTAKAIRTAAGIFEETQMSISFNVNDNFSISYTDSDDEYNAQDNASTAVASVSEETTALNMAYTMGGLSIKAFMMELSNPDYDSDATKVNETEIAIGLAF
jgi:outer membrane protein OmpU